MQIHSLDETRQSVRRRLSEAARADQRIMGVLDYGSSSEGRGDEWSDLDLALIINERDLESFQNQWKDWAAQFGPLMLAYISGVGHPWVVYDATPMPLRVDFAFLSDSALDEVFTWPNAPLSIEHMVLYDNTAGRLSANVSKIIGQSLAPPDPQEVISQVSGDLWYYLLRTWVQLKRGQHWAARHDFNFIIVGNMLALLRLEVGATERWLGSNASTEIERILSPQRLRQLEGLIPGSKIESLNNALLSAATLGQQVCSAISIKYAWDWPEDLSERVLVVLGSQGASSKPETVVKEFQGLRLVYSNQPNASDAVFIHQGIKDFIVISAQFPVTFNITRNLEAINSVLEQTNPGDLVLFPEGCLSGYSLDLSFLEDIDYDKLHQALDDLQRQAQQRQIHLWVGTVERKQGSWFNAAPDQLSPTIAIAPTGHVLGEIISEKADLLRIQVDLTRVSKVYLEQCRTDVVVVQQSEASEDG